MFAQKTGTLPRHSQTGDGRSLHNSFNNQQSSILMNSGGLAMQNLASHHAISDQARVATLPSKNSKSGLQIMKGTDSKVSAQPNSRQYMSGTTQEPMDANGAFADMNSAKSMSPSKRFVQSLNSQQHGGNPGYDQQKSGLANQATNIFSQPNARRGAKIQMF